MFTQHCFIRKNTAELRQKLSSLGWTANCFDQFESEWLAANYNKFISVDKGFEKLFPDDIDCGTNEDLFLALAALRGDKDYMQWFTDGTYFIQCDRQDWIDMYSTLCSGGKYTIEELDRFHKATVKELIEHFKQK